jgi:hypothetical protein
VSKRQNRSLLLKVIKMASGIFPEDIAGGVPIRNADGSPTNNPDVQNAYVPAPGFVSTCTMTALPTDCEARIEPRQINAIVSELVALAECMDPNGPWNCNSVTNLCAAFTEWVSLNIHTVFDGVSIVGSGTVADPYRVGLVDGGSY